MLTFTAAVFAGTAPGTRRFMHYMEASQCSCSFTTWERVVFSLILTQQDRHRG